jgi:hypothetical protein
LFLFVGDIMQNLEKKREDCRTVIKGEREDGAQFRPSDWIERIASQIAQSGQGKNLRYRDCARPRVINGEKCLVVEQRLGEKDPHAFAFVQEFALSNQLKVVEECEST